MPRNYRAVAKEPGLSSGSGWRHRVWRSFWWAADGLRPRSKRWNFARKRPRFLSGPRAFNLGGTDTHFRADHQTVN